MKDPVAWLKGKSARLFVTFAARYLARELYRGILGREPEAGELASCATAIKSTGSIAPQVKSQLTSSEFRNNSFDLEAPELVRAAYEGLLRRQPDAGGLDMFSTRLRQDRNIAALLTAFAECPEFKSLNRIAVWEYLAPMWSGQVQRVSVDATAEELDLLFERIRRGWTELGETEPHWSVFVTDMYKMKTFSEHEEGFYKTGLVTADLIEVASKRAGIKIDPGATVLELGCGTGRVTHVLANRYARVIAADVSPGNIRLCQEKLCRLGKTNVDYVLLKSPRDIQNIPPVDFFFSTIVLQHNPPPVIYYFLDQIFGKIRESGSVFFQVPTDCPGYSFDVTEYLASPAPVMEMHALPMRAVFSLFAKHGLTPAEVLMDGWTNQLGSHTFFAVRQ